LGYSSGGGYTTDVTGCNWACRGDGDDAESSQNGVGEWAVHFGSSRRWKLWIKVSEVVKLRNWGKMSVVLDDTVEDTVEDAVEMRMRRQSGRNCSL
jgi:hypothetical protein